MKQLLFLLLFPCLALAQYQGNANQKITLGEQTTADGLVWRGRLADTANLLTNKLDTSVYIVLDTGTRAMWYYRASTTPKWTRLVDSLNNLQGQLSLTTKVTGVLPVANGGTGQNTLALNKVMVGNGTSEVLTPTDLHWDNTNKRLGIGTADPVEKLHIIGNITITGATIASGNTKNLSIRGAQDFDNDEVKTISIGNTTFIMVANNNSGSGALFFCSYASATVVKIADPDNIGATSDTNGFICLYKDANSVTLNIKNRLGAKKGLTISNIYVGD